MAIQTDIIQPLKETLDKSKDIYILLPQNAGQEAAAAGLGLYHILNQAGNNVFVGCPTPLSQSVKSLPGSQHISAKIGNRNLVISLKVDNRDSIDKVSYNLDEDNKTFNLVIQPKKGEPPLKQKDVAFTYSGAQADIVFLMGVQRFEDLGEFYTTEKQLFTDAKTVSVSRFNGAPFTDFSISDTQNTCLSELVVDLAKTLQFALNADAATTLLAGIDSATNNLQSASVTAHTFETVAVLMKAGGNRDRSNLSQNQSTPIQAASPTQLNPTVIPSPTDIPQEWLAPKIYKSSDASQT